MRAIAWPVGESRELLIWVSVAQAIPVGCLLCALVLASALATNQLPAVATGASLAASPVKALLWREFCWGGVAREGLPTMEHTCPALEWLPHTLTVVLATPWVLKMLML